MDFTIRKMEEKDRAEVLSIIHLMRFLQTEATKFLKMILTIVFKTALIWKDMFLKTKIIF